jgi:hypothetical protein
MMMIHKRYVRGKTKADGVEVCTGYIKPIALGTAIAIPSLRCIVVITAK